MILCSFIHAKQLSQVGQYKLKYIGYALAWEYLKNIGIDGAKPDVHLRLILGKDRLGFSSKSIASENEAIQIVDEMSIESGYLKAEVDWLF